MRGRIFELDGKAKMEIWEDVWSIGEKIDSGGYCEICKKRFTSIHDLILHFMNEHKGGE